MKKALLLISAALVLTASFGLMAASPAATSLLPQMLPAVSPKNQQPTRGWTIPDIVEVTRITGTAIHSDHRVAFILKQPSIAENRDRYALYEMSADKPGSARKLLEAAYLADVQQRPDSSEWTFLGDLGQGVQLYAIDTEGRTRNLVMNPKLAPVGGNEGLVASSQEGPRQTGVLAYGWAPDGSALWYSSLKLLTAEQQRTADDGGIVFDDVTMIKGISTYGSSPALAVELHVFNPTSGSDRVIANAPGDRMTAMQAFQSDEVTWTDPDHLAYRLITISADGSRGASLQSVDVATGQSTPAKSQSILAPYNTVSTPQGKLALRREGEGHRLVLLAADGKVKQDFGHVDFMRMGADNGYWHDDKTGRAILGVSYPDHDGLTAFPASPSGKAWEKLGDQLDECAFTSDLSLGVCNRENLTTAPELVAVDPRKGTLTVLARPNARYDHIKPLHTVHMHWTNRYGSVNDGYVTWPRDYRAGHRYPAIVVTHGGDARNRFADHGFQWEYPVQVLAERGYVVLSVNEAQRDPTASNAYASGTSSDALVSTMQREFVQKPVASMEAAVESLVAQGLVDPRQVGIAGYSRGASVTKFALSLSKVFRAGAAGDADWFSAGAYWEGAVTRGIYNGLFGGSPLDPKAFPNYLKFSPSARAAQFSGPLLQQFTSDSADGAMELDAALKIAHIPTELVFYRDETHLLHQPRHRAWAMRLGLQWFDYWLRDLRDPEPVSANQYQRWGVMAKTWRAPAPSTTADTPKVN